MKGYELENLRLTTENRQLRRQQRELYSELKRLFAAADMPGDAPLYNVVKFMESRWKEIVENVV